MSCSGGTNKVGMIAAARTGKLDGASIFLSLSHKSKRRESPLHSPLLPIHSCISLFIVTFHPLSKQETKRKWRNEKDDVPTFRLEAVPLVPKLLSSSRRACEIHHEPRRGRERDRENVREGELQFLRRSRMSVWRALFF